MEPLSTVLFSALGYILKGALQSKAVKTAKEEILDRFWQWIRHKFIKDIPEIEDRADTPEIETRTQEKLLQLIRDKDFFQELAERVQDLQKAGIKEKNIVKKDIRHVKKIIIGDKEFSGHEPYDRKNIVEGCIEDADEFILGDGH